jgi:hypothetical protein
VSSVSLPVNRREGLYYVLLATMGVWLVVLGGAAVWYALPYGFNERVRPIEIGTLADFPPSETPRQILLKEGLPVWVVRTEEALYIFDAHAPYYDRHPHSISNRCYYAWNEATGRFEDPCSGEKWALTGERIKEDYIHEWSSQTRLDELVHEVTADGRILVSADSRVLVWPETVQGE